MPNAPEGIFERVAFKALVVYLFFLYNILLRDGMQSIGGENIVFKCDCWVVYLGYGMTL